MSKLVIYGYQGFVGREIYKCLADIPQDLIGINREAFSKYNYSKSDSNVVIHCANSARRFYVNNNCELDLSESAGRTNEILERHPDSKKILISTISCRTRPWARGFPILT